MPKVTKVPGKSLDKYQVIRDVLRSCLKHPKFQEMRSRESDLENMFMALMHKESILIVGSQGRPSDRDNNNREITYGAGYKFLQHPKVKAVIALENPTMTHNIKECTKAFGLAQSMGFNHVKGISTYSSGNVCVMEDLIVKHGFEPSWVSRLVINPGDSMTKIMGNLGDPAINSITLTNQIMAGLIILFDKWKMVDRYSDGVRWYTKAGGATYINHSRLLVAIGAYLGYLGTDAMGSDAQGYVAQITGKHYQDANNNLGSNLVSSSFEVLNGNKPAKVALSENTKKALGCTA